MSQNTENTVKSSFRHNFSAYLLSDPECFARDLALSSQSLEAAAADFPVGTPQIPFVHSSPRRFADASPIAVDEPTYAFSFPLCDLLICELDTPEAKLTPFYISPKPTKHLTSRTATDLPAVNVAVRGVLSVAEYIFQKVVRRKPVPFFHNENVPNYLGCYVVETLACGHEKTVYPTELETLTARKRNCHECSGWIGALHVGKRKAPASVKGIVRKRKDVGESPWWAVGFAIGCASLLIFGIFYALQPQDFYQVTARQDDFNQTFQQVHRGKALAPAVMFFCEPQPFEAGHTLTSFKFDYHVDKLCYSVSAYSLLRDSTTCPKVPANCSHTDCAHPVADHILCEGKPRF